MWVGCRDLAPDRELESRNRVNHWRRTPIRVPVWLSRLFADAVGVDPAAGHGTACMAWVHLADERIACPPAPIILPALSPEKESNASNSNQHSGK